MSKLGAFLTVAAAATVFLSVSVPTQAQNYYTINGRGASYAEAMYLAAQGVPPGAYWIDARGNIARAAPGYNRRTLGGDIMSDGRCSFVAGVPVGNCN
jgi:hypothetical protein